MNKQNGKHVLRYYLGGPIYSIAGPAFLVFLFITSEFIVGLRPIGIALCTVIVAIPILFNGVYHASTSRILFLQGFRCKGRIFWWCSGYLIRLLLHTIVGFCSAVVLVTELLYSPSHQLYIWGSIVLCVILIPTAYSIAERITYEEVYEWLTGKISLTIASVAVAILVTSLYTIVTSTAIDPRTYDSARAAIASQPQFAVNDPSVELLFDLYNQARGTAEYAFGVLTKSDIGALTYAAFYVTMLFLFFVGITSAISTFCLPASELKRAISRPTTAAPSLSRSSVAIPVAIVLTVSAGYLYGFWGLSRGIERIHNQLVRHGTIDLIEQRKQHYETLLRLQLSEVSGSGLSQMESSIETMTVTMRSNVDGFLNWYYSPLGEGFRTISRVHELISRNGSREEALVQRLFDELLDEVPIATLDGQWEALHQASEALIEATRKQFNVERNQILAASVVDSAVAGPTTTIESVELPEFDIADELRDSMRLRRESFLRRQNSSLLLGGVGGAVAGTVVARTVLKGGLGGVDRIVRRIPRAVRPLARSVLLGSRVVAASTGVGLLAMVVLTVGSEYALLKLHELKDRPQFRDRIMEAIDRAEQELKAELRILFGS